MDEKDKHIQEAQLPTEQTPPIAPQQDKKSGLIEQYQQIMSKYIQSANTIVEKTIDSLNNNHDIKYYQQFIPNFTLTFFSESINKEVVILNAKWGNFEMNIKVLNIKGSNTQHVRQTNRGMYGSIHCGQFNKKRFAMKCIPFHAKNSRFRAVREWFLMKIASTFQVGPKIEAYFGFDILMFEECIQFSMEKCQEIKANYSTYDYFYQNLAVLHKLHLVHQDIKPENIMYSQNFGRPIFIDFGLSKIIKENLGEKTLSNYVGTINFWSPEMKQSFLEKKAKLIDLYYNDVFGIKQTIDCFKTSQNIAENGNEIGAFGEQEIQHFSYLSLVLGKFYLYYNRFIDFLNFTKQEKSNGVSSFQSNYDWQILLFFEELTPTRQITKFFEKIVKDEYKQTMIYSKLNILYQISKKNFCSLDIFMSQDKYNYFEKMSLQILIQDKEEPNINQQSQNVSKFIINEQLIKQTPFIHYLRMYLDYTSYIQDKYQVTAEKRIEAARVYQDIFLKPEDCHQLIPRQIVSSTIEHALKWCLEQSDYKNQSHKNIIVSLFFKIYDFMVILDTINSSDFFMWIEKIYRHSCFSDLERALLLLRIIQSNVMNSIRLSKKDSLIRINFYIKIMQWVNQKSRINPIKVLVEEEVNKLSYQFQQDFALQIVKTYIIDNEIQQPQMMVQKYYELIGQRKRQKIFYFIPYLFRMISQLRQNSYFINQISNICRTCIRDETIMKQFSFDLEKFILDIFYYQATKKINVEDFKYLNDQTMKIQTGDLFFLQPYLQRIWNVAQSMEIIRKLDLSFIYNQKGFFHRMLVSSKQYHANYIQNEKLPHICSVVKDINNLLILSNKFSENMYNQYKLILMDNQMWSSIGCDSCQHLRQWALELDQFRCLFELQSLKKRFSTQVSISNEEILSNTFARYTKVWQRISGTKHFKYGQQQLIERILDYVQKLCQSYRSYQNQYHGIYNYYRFASKIQLFTTYFQETQNLYRLFFTLEILKIKSMEILAYFLFELSTQFSRFLIVKWQTQLRNCLVPFFSEMKDNQHQELFEYLKGIEKKISEGNLQNIYVALIYSYLLVASRSISFLHRTSSAVFKKINRIHFNFKRNIAMTIYDKINCTKLIYLTKRQRLYNRNKLVKLLMIDGQATEKVYQEQKGDIFEMKFQEKMGKINAFKKGDRIVKFRKK